MELKKRKKRKRTVVYKTLHNKIIARTFFVAVTAGDGGQVAVTVTVPGKRNGMTSPITSLEDTFTVPPGGIIGITPLFGPDSMMPPLKVKSHVTL